MGKKNSANKLVLKGKTLKIYIFDDIGYDWGFTPNQLVEKLDEVGEKAPVEVYINSLGGQVHQGLTIYNLLRSHKGPITTICTGIAASIASVIFLSGSTRQIYENATVMIHSPLFSAYGNKKEFQKAMEILEQSEDQILDIYTSRTNQERDQIKNWMEEETYFTAEQSVEYGFATEVLEGEDVAATADLKKLVAKLGVTLMPKKRDPKFLEWLTDYCKPLDMAPKDFSDEKLNELEAHYKTLEPGNTTTTVTEPPPSDDLIAKQREAVAAEEDRVNSIRDYADRNRDVKLNAETLKEKGVTATTMRGLVSHAIRKGWTVDKFELTARQCEMVDIGHVGIHTASNPLRELNKPAMLYSLCRSTGVNMELIDNQFDDKAKEASDSLHVRELSLHGVLNEVIRSDKGSSYAGRCNTDGFITAVRESLWNLKMTGNTSWTALNIFDDLANKMLWAAYENQSTTWQRWVRPVSVNDFKTHNFYRMNMLGGYMEIGADGEIKHGGLSDAKYTVAARTFGKMVGLARKDIINDDLGALNTIMSALGAEGAKFLEEMFYVYLLTNIATIFPIDGSLGNYIVNFPLSVDSLSEGEKTFMNQVDADNAPLLIMPDILLVGTALAVKAKEIYEQANLQGVQTANVKGRPDGNPHVGKFEPVVSPYLNNTSILQRTDFVNAVGSAIPNQSVTQWLLFPKPSNAYGATIIGAFLNGQQRPTIEQGDPAFDVLGLQWRAYHDAGVGTGDPKLALHARGAAAA